MSVNHIKLRKEAGCENRKRGNIDGVRGFAGEIFGRRTWYNIFRQWVLYKGRCKVMLKKIIISVLMIIIAQTVMADFATTVLGREILNPNAAYEIFSSSSINPPLKLNTRNGCMTQIQIVKGEVRESPINLVPLVSASEEQNGRFTLYEGKYVSQSVLLDRISGKVWYVFFGALNPKDNRIEETAWHSGEE